VLTINSLVYFALSFITVPLYTIGVQMGSDFKPHIFSPDVTAYSETQPAQQTESVRGPERQGS